jgi:DNA (cytosine-5)-methyltransferase 1
MDKKSTSIKTAIDLFSGAGGLSLGLRRAGWKLLASIEIDKDSVQTYRRNFNETRVLNQDVRDIEFSQFRGADLVAGGPPCQPFSVAGKQLANEDSRDMVPEFLRAVKEIQPKLFLMENVPGLMSKKHEEYVSTVKEKFDAIGYDISNIRILNAADYGVPQYRKRVFFVGLKKSHSFSFSFPEPTHGEAHNLPNYISTREALSDIPPDLPNNSIVTYAKNPVMRKSPWAGMYLNGKGRPINLDTPAPTIPASAGGNRTHIIDEDGVLLEYHSYLLDGGTPRRGTVEGVRRLTVRESARLQTFPDDFEFLGSRSSQYRQIGNAVPPLLSEQLGTHLMKTLESKEKVVKKQTTGLPLLDLISSKKNLR